MTRATRLKRLRDLIAEIELLPASPERDRLLSEFRSRAVDIDTGVPPRAMLPMAEPAPEPVRGAARLRRTPAVPTVKLTRPAAPAGRTVRPGEPYWVAEWFSLDDPEPPPVQTRGGRAVPPWTLGLRG